MPAVVITSPADERFITEANAADPAVRGDVRVREKIWSRVPVRQVVAKLGTGTIQMSQVRGTAVWEGVLSDSALEDSVHEISVLMTDEAGKQAADTIHAAIGECAYKAPQRAERDLENALEEWPKHGLLGTQLGPNKNGKKW